MAAFREAWTGERGNGEYAIDAHDACDDGGWGDKNVNSTVLPGKRICVDWFSTKLNLDETFNILNGELTTTILHFYSENAQKNSPKRLIEHSFVEVVWSVENKNSFYLIVPSNIKI